VRPGDAFRVSERDALGHRAPERRYLIEQRLRIAETSFRRRGDELNRRFIYFYFFLAAIVVSFSMIVALVSFLNTNRCAREVIVGGSFSNSVVAKMITACLGGSSKVLSNALNAAPVSMCASSII